MRLIFIRHGDPDYLNDTLTERGRKEAEALAKRVQKWDVDKFYCSPLGRAKATAEISLKGTGTEPEVFDWLREFHAPVADPHSGERRIPWDFMPSYWTKEEALYDRNGWHRADVMKTGNVESEFLRVCGGLDKILESHGYKRKGAFYVTEEGNTKTIVFFCHLGVEFAMLSHLLGISAPCLWQGFFVAPTSVTVLETEERVKGEAYFRCKRLGDVSHLFKEGIEPSNSGFFEEIYKG